MSFWQGSSEGLLPDKFSGLQRAERWQSRHSWRHLCGGFWQGFCGHSDGAQRSPSYLEENEWRKFIQYFDIKQCGKDSRNFLAKSSITAESVFACMDFMWTLWSASALSPRHSLCMRDWARIKVGLCPTPCTNWQESISYSSTAPLHRVWAPARAQLRKMFLLSGMAINRALPEPRGDGCLHVHSVLKDKHNTIPFILISSFWVSSSPCLAGCQDDWFCWGLPSRSSLRATVAWQKNLEKRADLWGHRQCHRYLSEA